MDVITRIGGSKTVFILCLIPIIGTWIQSILFLRKGLNEAKRIGMTEQRINKVMTNTAIFSILPTIPIIITMGPLIKVLGRYIPWLRLSVVGSAPYESIAADIALKSYGLGALGEATITEPAFVTVVMAMTFGIMLSPILTLFALKPLDKKIKKVQTQEGSGFVHVAFSALFLGLIAVLAVPIAVNVKNPVGILTIVTSGAAVLLLEKLAVKMDKNIIKDFAFPLAMIIGMGSAVFWTKLF